MRMMTMLYEIVRNVAKRLLGAPLAPVDATSLQVSSLSTWTWVRWQKLPVKGFVALEQDYPAESFGKTER